jgi:sugar phosphate isomerase/epimerase
VRLGVCTITALDRPLEEAARAAGRAGAEGVELTARPPHWRAGAGRREAEAARRVLDAAGLAALAFGSYLGKDAPPGPEEPERTVEAAAAMGAPCLRVWAEPAAGGGREEALLDLLRRCVDRAAARGLTVVVERHLGSLADDAERVERLLDAVPGLALAWQPLDGLPQGQVGAQPADAARLGPRARHVHLKNYRVDAASGRLHLGASLARGALDWRRILATLRRGGYDGALCVEFTRFDAAPLEERLAADLAFARQAWEEAPPPGGADTEGT